MWTTSQHIACPLSSWCSAFLVPAFSHPVTFWGSDALCAEVFLNVSAHIAGAFFWMSFEVEVRSRKMWGKGWRAWKGRQQSIMLLRHRAPLHCIANYMCACGHAYVLHHVFSYRWHLCIAYMMSTCILLTLLPLYLLIIKKIVTAFLTDFEVQTKVIELYNHHILEREM